MFQLNSLEPASWPSFVLTPDGERQLAAQQRQAAPAGARPPGGVAISLHAHHLDLVDGLLERLESSGLATSDLWITTDSLVKAEGIQGLLARRQAWGPGSWTVQVMTNRGRNVRPLLHQLHHHLQAYGAVLHLHTKRSWQAEGFGDPWRHDLVEKLAGSPAQVALALALLAEPAVGLVLPCRFAGIDRHYKWASEFPMARQLLAGLHPDRRLSPSNLLVFPAGMMFWCRPSCLRRLAALVVAGPLAEAFEPEPLPNRATLPHALERILCHTCEAEGYGWRLIDRPGAPAPVAATSAAVDAGLVSVWGDGDGAYHRLLADLTGALQELQRGRRQRRRAMAQVVALEPCRPRRARRGQQLWTSRPPLTIGLVLRYGPHDDLAAAAHVRLLRPLAPAVAAGTCRLLLPEAPDDPLLQSCDAVVVQAGALPRTEGIRQWRQRCRQARVPLVVDLDDDLREPIDGSSAMAALLAAADHLVAATPLLLQHWTDPLAAAGRRVPPATLLASGLDRGLWAGPLSPLPSADAGPPLGTNRLRILCLGRGAADQALAPLLEPLEVLERRRPGQFELVLVGRLRQPLKRAWLTQLEVPRGQRTYGASVAWLRRLGRCDLGVLPLPSTSVGSAANALGVLELTALGLPCLCATGSIDHPILQRGRVLALPRDGWTEALERAIDDPAALAPMARAARRHLWRHCRSDQMGRQLLALLGRL